MHIKKRLMAPALMLAAIFSGNAARAQNIAPLPDAALPDAPKPQGDAPKTPDKLDGVTFDAEKKFDLKKLDLSALPRAAGTPPGVDNFDYRLPQQNPPGPFAASGMPSSAQRVAIFADRHLINGQEGYSIAGEIKIKDRFSIIAGTRDYGYQIDTRKWDNNGMNFKPEIPLWTSERGSMSLKPKGRGVMIGFKMSFQ